MKRFTFFTMPLLFCGIFLSSQKSISQNLLVDGNFATTTSIPPFFADPPPLFQWCHLDGTSATFKTNVQNGVVSYLIDNAGSGFWEVQLDQFGFSLQANHRYRLSFDVKADADRDFGVFIGEHGGNWTNLNPAYLRHATADWQTITIDLNSISVFPFYQLSFEMGSQNINTYFRNISLIDLGPIPVVIAGTFQAAVGCASDWMPDCDNTALTYNSSTGLWSGSFNIPAGCHQYKVAIGGSWDENYGENGILYGANINLYVPTQTLITFTYDAATHLVTTSPIASGFSTNCLPQVVLTGSFQTALGCGADWDANCQNTALSFNAATGKFEGDFNIPSGYYEYRAILNGDWVGNMFGDGGVPNGSPYSIYLCEAATVHFAYDPVTHVVTNDLNAQSNTVVIAGSFQSELGCSSDWQADCDNTRLTYDPIYGTWTGTFDILAGHWEYKIAINNSWDENYGLYGVKNGDNITLDLCAPSKVTFTYRHYNCYHSVDVAVVATQPKTVVIAGSFQSELGCASDWQADCNNTRMTFDPDNGTWSDTLLIPAGHWEYKWTINDSWVENYGLYGEPNGPAISLDLCYPSKVVFNLTYENCYVFGYAYSITNGVCLTKFYDANVNGYPDPGEEPMGGVTFTLTGNGITQTQTTSSDGKTSFTGLPDGFYMIKEKVPAGYFAVTDSQFVYVFSSMANPYFGNVCTGPGGAKGLGFWTSKNGEAALTQTGTIEYTLAQLRNLSLRNADGTEFDPYTYGQLSTYLKGASAKNMAYMLSAQLATMFLNTEMGYVDRYNSYIHTPGCFWWGNFMNVDVLIWYTNYYLSYKTTADGKDPDRGYLECLKNAFDNANNNLAFVQPHPCGGATTSIDRRGLQELNEVRAATVKIWPNPSNNYFTLRPADYGNKEAVELKVYNVNGQQVFRASGFSNRDYQFGEQLLPGIYMAEFIQGNNKTTFKLVKQ